MGNLETMYKIEELFEEEIALLSRFISNLSNMSKNDPNLNIQQRAVMEEAELNLMQIVEIRLPRTKTRRYEHSRKSLPQAVDDAWKFLLSLEMILPSLKNDITSIQAILKKIK